MATDKRFVGRTGSYAISGVRPIAYGRASVLWLAKDATGDELVVKLYRDAPVGLGAPLTEFEHETRARAALKHPNILPVLDWGIDDTDAGEPVPFLVFPYCSLGDLRGRLRGTAFLPLDAGIPVLRQVAAAIDHAHVRGFIHGDIKPENVLFWRTPEHACVTDFGASHYFPQRVQLSHSSAVRFGTPIYLSPEELDGGRATTASDIYAFGLVAFEVLVGALPFDSSNPYRAMGVRIEGDLKPARALNPRLSREIERAFFSVLNVDPANRPPSASRFVELLESGGATATSYTTVAQSKNRVPSKLSSTKFSSRQRIVLISAIITALVTIATAIINVVPQLRGRADATRGDSTHRK